MNHKILYPIEDTFERWITAPEKNAAGRIGLFRMVFSIYCLWIQSNYIYAQMGEIPSGEWNPITFLRGVITRPPAAGFHLMEISLIISLVLLLFGYRTRFSTLLVLILGFTLDAFRYSFGKAGHESLFMVFYIPLLMVFSDWSSTYSLDNFLKKRHGLPIVNASESSWRYIWPMRVTLLILIFLFFSDAVSKINGTWLTDAEIVPKILLMHNILGIQRGYDPNLFAAIIASYPAVYLPFHVVSLAFMGLFWIALFGRRLQAFFIAIAVLFHSFNAFVMNIHFNAVLVAYFIFVDWQAVYEFLRLERLKLTLGVEHLRSAIVIGLAVTAAVAAGLLWTDTLQPLLMKIPELSIWYVVAPPAFIIFLICSVQLLREGWHTLVGPSARREKPKP